MGTTVPSVLVINVSEVTQNVRIKHTGPLKQVNTCNNGTDRFLRFLFQLCKLFFGFSYFPRYLYITKHCEIQTSTLAHTHSDIQTTTIIPTLLVCLLIFFNVLVIISHAYNLESKKERKGGRS